ncbi:glyoxalase superfamily protein [Nocardiopsis sp. ARC36]
MTTGGPVQGEAVPILRVADAEAASARYRRPGSTREWEHRFEPGLPAFVGVARGQVRPFLSEHEGDARPTPWSTCGYATSTRAPPSSGSRWRAPPGPAGPSCAPPTATACGWAPRRTDPPLSPERGPAPPRSRRPPHSEADAPAVPAGCGACSPDPRSPAEASAGDRRPRRRSRRSQDPPPRPPRAVRRAPARGAAPAGRSPARGGPRPP